MQPDVSDGDADINDDADDAATEVQTIICSVTKLLLRHDTIFAIHNQIYRIHTAVIGTKKRNTLSTTNNDVHLSHSKLTLKQSIYII